MENTNMKTKAVQTKSITITLTMSEEEAQCLAGMIQNPVHGQTLKEEGDIATGVRESIWDALCDALN
jgi:hypothetical protein